MQALAAAFFLLAPAGVIYLAHHQRWAAKVGVIVLCYFLGLVIGAAGLLPAAVAGVPESVSEISLVLALPLLLFTLDMRQWSRVAGKALLSLFFAALAVMGLATLLFVLYRGDTGAEPGLVTNLAAMSVGVYTGGTPNLAAIKAGLDIPNAQYLAFHSLDALAGSFYLLFMLTLGVPLFRRLLPGKGGAAASQADTDDHPDEDDYRPLLVPANLRQVITALLLSALVVAVAMGVAQLFAWCSGGEANSAVLIVALTTLGIALSLVPRVRALLLSYRIGMYLIYVFCMAVSALVSVEELLNMDVTVAVFVLVVVFGSLALHALFCRLAGIDGDTFMVTSVAAVGSPPFVPLMVRALDNPAAMLPGMTVGVIGYALGSYLGISLGLYLGTL